MLYLGSANITTNVSAYTNTSNSNSNGTVVEGKTKISISTTSDGKSTNIESNESGEIRVESKKR
jgi:hypothetical protein